VIGQEFIDGREIIRKMIRQSKSELPHLIAVRHARSRSNEQMILDCDRSSSDYVPPSELETFYKRVERYIASNALLQEKQTVILSSELPRAKGCVSTLTSALSRGPTSVIYDSRLNDRFYGTLDQRSYSPSMDEKLPYGAWSLLKEADLAGESSVRFNAETQASLVSRVAECLAEIYTTFPGHCVFLLSHADIIQVMWALYDEEELQHYSEVRGGIYPDYGGCDLLQSPP
jgi:broad specificity phosphatase PhoE